MGVTEAISLTWNIFKTMLLALSLIDTEKKCDQSFFNLKISTVLVFPFKRDLLDDQKYNCLHCYKEPNN